MRISKNHKNLRMKLSRMDSSPTVSNTRTAEMHSKNYIQIWIWAASSLLVRNKRLLRRLPCWLKKIHRLHQNLLYHQSCTGARWRRSWLVTGVILFLLFFCNRTKSNFVIYSLMNERKFSNMKSLLYLYSQCHWIIIRLLIIHR